MRGSLGILVVPFFPNVNAIAASETQQCLTGVSAANSLTMARGGDGYWQETANGLTMAIDDDGGDRDCLYWQGGRRRLWPQLILYDMEWMERIE